jgi:hypothetical protein
MSGVHAVKRSPWAAGGRNRLVSSGTAGSRCHEERGSSGSLSALALLLIVPVRVSAADPEVELRAPPECKAGLGKVATPSAE